MSRCLIIINTLCMYVLLTSVTRSKADYETKSTRSQLTLQDNGYRNLVIAINDRVPEDPNLIKRIKMVFEETSRFLYRATKQRAYFDDIRILLPTSWSDSNSYEPVQNERYDISDVRIDLPSKHSGDDGGPYTNNPTQCGISGLYIHLTPDYLTNVEIAKRFGDYDKVLVHEWAHYRWGVFDEYPLTGMSHFYATSNGDIEAVRCVLAIPGVRATEEGESCTINNNGLPDNNCRFVDNRFADGYTGSLMYRQFLPKITTFCQEEPIGSYRGNVHNREAPNRQNLLCDGRSIWEVMLEHQDFADGANEPSDVEDRVPTFTIVKEYNKRLMLVLDMSGSMEGERLRLLRQAARNLIINILRDGEELGIVTFSEEAYRAASMTVIDATSRQDLLSKLPTAADGATTIGAGVAVGLDVLRGSIKGSQGSRMLVITDGEENTAPYIADILHLIEGTGVRIYTIAIGQNASQNLELLASITGGTSYYHKNGSNTLNEAFGKINSNDQDNIEEISVDVFSKIVTITTTSAYEDLLFIDSSIGHNTHLIFGYSLEEGIDVTLTSPSGIVIDKQSAQYTDDDRFGLVQIAIAENAEEGEWKFRIVNLASDKQSVTISVQSQSRKGEEPITIQAQWGFDDVKPPETQILYVTVAKGYTPVVNSLVEAAVSIPDSNNVYLVLKDNGVGADVTANDGIYSTYFTEFNGLGRYSVQVSVKSHDTDTYIASGSVVGVGAIIDPEFATSQQGEDNNQTSRISTGVFQRIANGGSFTCNTQDGCTGKKDVYAPSRISDLSSDSVKIVSKTVELTFTAPGDDLTIGTASYYIIRMGTNFTALYDDFEAGENVTDAQLESGKLNEPKPGGSREIFVVRITEVGNFSYVFAVAAIDDQGNRGPRSNIAISTARDFRTSSVSAVWLAVGLGLTIIVLIVIVICVVFLICRRTKRDKEEHMPTGRRKTNVTNRSDDVAYTPSGYERDIGSLSTAVDLFQNRIYVNI